MVCMERGSVRHMWPERAGFFLNRQTGLPCYTFLHFFNSVELLTPEGLVTTKPDACFVYPPDMHQYFLSREPLVHDWMHFEPDVAQQWAEYGLDFARIYYPHTPQFITDTLSKLEAESLAQHPFYEKLIDAKLTEFFIEFSRVCASPPPSVVISSDTRERFRKFRLELLTRLNEDWTVKRMASYVSLSPSYFHTIYKEIYGTSPIQDLISARIATAKNLLQGSDYSIAEIAERLGYNSPYHFTRQFRQTTGQSPSAYRKRSV